MNYTEFPIFPMVTYDYRTDSPENARWKIIVSVPQNILKKPPTLNTKSGVFLVGEWLVIVWSKVEKLTGPRMDEIVLYESFKGNVPPNIQDLGEAPTRAIWRQEWATLIEVRLKIDMQNRRRYSGAIVEGDNSIQVWLRL